MKELKYLDNEICDLAVGSIQNLTFQREELTQQQTFEIVLLYEIFNFHLSILDDEQAWDFMAMTYYAYNLCSENKETYYYGPSDDPDRRLPYHNSESKGFLPEKS